MKQMSSAVRDLQDRRDSIRGQLAGSISRNTPRTPNRLLRTEMFVASMEYRIALAMESILPDLTPGQRNRDSARR